MEPARPDIFHVVVDLTGHFSDCRNRLFLENQINPLRCQKGFILGNQGVFRFQKDTNKVFHGQGIQFHPNWKSPLKLRKQIRRFADIECPRSNKEDMVCLDHTVFGGHRRPFYNGQQISLNPLSGNIRPVGRAVPRHLIQFIQEDNAVLFGNANRFFNHFVHINQALGFLLEQDFHGFRNFDTPFLFLLGKHVAENFLDVEFHLFHAGT